MDYLSAAFVTELRYRVVDKLVSIYYMCCCMLVIIMLIVAWAITICVYLAVYMVIVPISLIKYLFSDRN